MKAIILLLALLTFSSAFSQGKVKVEMQEQFESDRIFENELYCPGEIVPKLLKEFEDGARYYKVDYKLEFESLKEVLFVNKDLGFLGDVSEDKKTIYLNRELLQYPNLTRVIFFRQIGKIYGAKEGSPSNHAIMSPHWDIDKKHEQLAINTRSRPDQRKKFFEILEVLKPLNKRL